MALDKINLASSSFAVCRRSSAPVEFEWAAADNLLLDAAGFIESAVFETEHRVDDVLSLQRPEPVLPPPAGVSGAVVGS